MALIKTSQEIQNMRRAGEILSHTAKLLLKSVGEGISLMKLDQLALEVIRKEGGKPSFLNYKPHGADKAYPASICTSVNDVIVHCAPTDYILKNGDVLKIDMGVSYSGYHVDAAWTLGVGKISAEAKKLIEVTQKSLDLGIKVARGGNTLGDIGAAISSHVHRNKFSVVEGLTGHGIGQDLHEEPSVFNIGKRGSGLELIPGMTLAIEPMVSVGSPKIKKLSDDSYVMVDGSLSAHFEHTILITQGKPEILTMLR